MSTEPLTRERLEYVCEHGVKNGHTATRFGAVHHILATDAALRARVEEQQREYAVGAETIQGLKAQVEELKQQWTKTNAQYESSAKAVTRLMVQLAQVTQERELLTMRYDTQLTCNQLLEEGLTKRDVLLAQAQARVEQWRQWVQFVWKSGGPIQGTDQELQAAVCLEFDARKACPLAVPGEETT